MSLKKQIKRNIERNTKQTLQQYEPFLAKNWQSKPLEDLNLFASIARNGITIEDLNREIKKARQQAFEDTALSIMKVTYACLVLVLAEEFNFSKDDCYKALTEVDHKMSLAIDGEELIKEMENNIGIRFNSGNGIERIEKL